MANQGDFIAEKAIYVDAAGKVVDASDPSKLTKIADVGARVSDADVQKYGLKKEKPKAEKPEESTESRPRAVVGDKVTVGKKDGEIAAVDAEGYATKVKLSDGTEVDGVKYEYADAAKAKADKAWQKAKDE